MQLKVLIPTRVLIDQPVAKIVAEAENGAFCLLPRHIDFLSALIPGIFAFETADGEESFLAIDEGILIKVGAEVLVSTRNAFEGTHLASLKQDVERQFQTLDEQERLTRSALARLEASLARRFTALSMEFE